MGLKDSFGSHKIISGTVPGVDVFAKLDLIFYHCRDFHALIRTTTTPPAATHYLLTALTTLWSGPRR